MQVIYTEASSGRTVIELWKEGRRVDGEEQVVQEGAPASATTKTPPAPASRATSTSTPLPVSARANAVESAIPRRPPLLTRKGEGTREFYFGETSRSGGGEDGAGVAAESAREMSRRLRSETERERRSMLLDIFEAAHSRRRRRRRRRVQECGEQRC